MVGGGTVSPNVTLTQGTLTGTGNVTTVDVGAGTGGVISNNDGVAGLTLTINTLTLNGGANFNLFSNGTSTGAPLVVGNFINNSANGTVTVTANNPSGWSNGSTYDVISYTTLGGTGGVNFAQAVNNLSARQSATWESTPTALTLTVNGDTPYWTGAVDGNWNTTTEQLETGHGEHDHDVPSFDGRALQRQCNGLDDDRHQCGECGAEHGRGEQHDEGLL